MRYLIVSDLHANLEALEAVTGDAAGHYEQAICCGDLVGYGAEPNPVVDWVREHCSIAVRGNHDKACTGQEALEWFNPVARAAALWTLENLTPANAEYIRSLPQGPILQDAFQVVHGSPFDEDEYVLAVDEAEQAFGYIERRLVFFGHTHVQCGFVWNQSRVEMLPRVAPGGGPLIVEVDSACAYLINPGSVGQPRDNDPRAGYALYDSDARLLQFRRVAYDVKAAQEKILAAGLPPPLAERLLAGR